MRKIGMTFMAVMCGLLIVQLCASASDLRVEGGKLSLGGTIEADTLVVGAGAEVIGSGVVEGAGEIAGAISPGDGSTTSVSTISFSDTLVFQAGSAFNCYAATHTSLDKLEAGGAVSGTCNIYMTKATNAIPLHQVIIDGGGASDYDSFAKAGPAAADWELESVAGENLEVTDIVGDTDADTLPDWWEFEYFTNRTNANPGVDGDVDGMLNWQERTAGTDPTDDTSLLQMHTVANGAEVELLICWDSVLDKEYTILRTTNLIGGAISVVASNIAATPPENTYTNSVTVWDHYYYRIEVQR